MQILGGWENVDRSEFYESADEKGICQRSCPLGLRITDIGFAFPVHLVKVKDNFKPKDPLDAHRMSEVKMQIFRL